MSRPTVVSAYYPIKSKYPIDNYVKWIVNFWPKTTFPLVFYTDPSIVPQFEKIFEERPQTKIVGVALRDFHAFTKLSARPWLTAHIIDCEADKHTPELYAIWYEKKEFVLRTIESNPFGSDSFVWCDAGICRFPEWLQYLQNFPLRAMIPSGKMTVLRINPFGGEVKDGIPGWFDRDTSVGGGILAGERETWSIWSKAYDAMLMKYILAGRFIGKDQNIMASMILDRPELAVLIDPPDAMERGQIWFYLLFFLGGVSVG